MNKKLIWIADDDPIFRMIFRLTIKKVVEDLTIVEFENGKIICESFQKSIENMRDIPRCLFMDVNMPVMNGWSCLDQIRDLAGGANVIMPKIFIMSSSIDRDDEKRTAHYPHVTDYLRKPISIEKFEKILTR